ncbi:MAG: hypothetical protein OER90_18495 [Gemmatimonadota bacterium]|nr:hypothetical protein [Gemmatimonadota bacterium]
MRRHWGRLLPALALLAGACSLEQLTLGEGTTSTLAVRVYVDADGDGAYTGSDVPVAGATVTATSGGVDVSETADADGLATFQSLAPGSYKLAVSATPPAGAVLASASNPGVAAPFQGGTLSAEFRYAFLPGDLSGRIFRDDNANGTYEAGEDTPAGGVPVAVREAGGATDIATTSTDVDGIFAFDDLRPGNYDIEVTPFQTITIVGGNTVNAAVNAAATTAIDILFTGNLVISMADARAAAAGEVVTVEAVITWQPSFDLRQYFFQDGTAGMSTFDTNSPALLVGDSVRITGQRGAFRGEEQISPVTALEVLGNVGEPTPRLVSGAEINAGNFQAELVTIDGTLDSVQVFGFDNHSLFLTDGAAEIFTAYVDSRIGVASTDWTSGQPYSLVGVLGSDDRNTFQYRIEPRQPSDAVLGGSTVDIATARTQSGATVTVEGVVTWQQNWDSRVYFLQDATGGISTFHSGAPTLARGDRIRVVGTVGAFRGEVQISTDAVSILGNEAVPTARTVTGVDINGGLYQGELVTIGGTVDSLFTDGFDNQTVWLSDAADTDFVTYVDSRNGVASTAWTLGASVTLFGVLGTDDRNTPAARLEIRDIQDIQ